MPNTNSSSYSYSSYQRNGLSTDIYDIAEYVNAVKQEFTPDVDEDTLMLGIFGYFGSLMSNMFQNDIIMAAEFANESIPTRAKFDKNVIAHALGLNITSINATPAKMEVLLTFIEDEIINAIGGGSGDFIFDCDNKIYFDNLEFHVDYDIIIRRIRLKNGSFTYTARYDMTGDGVYDNPVSDITNPYLTPPVTMKVNGTSYLFTSCIIRQVEKNTIYKKVLSDNTISSKTVNFEFDSQMAAFDIDVVTGSTTTHLVPVYEGLYNTTSRYPYFWFTYLDSDTIRIKFDRDSYAPRVNADVNIRLQTTQGNAGNFTWVAEYPLFSFDSDRLGYSNITVQVRPLTGESKYGVDKKSIDDLKKIIPREALARGSITNTKDLYNFFNAIDTDSSQMYLYKKRDNNMERLYYTYIVMKDALSNIIPTNTINLMIRPDQLYTDVNRARLILRKGQVIKLDSDKTTGFISRKKDEENTDDPDYTDGFEYIIPYNFAICMDPMYGMYFLTTMDESRSLTFSYINEECLYQYIATAVDWKREYLENDDTYKLTIDIEQNITDDDSMITVDPDGNVTNTNVRCFVVFYDDNDVPYRYAEGTIVNYKDAEKIATFEFTMSSQDYIDRYNRIRVEGLYPTNALNQVINYGYMPANCRTMIHIVTMQPEYSTDLNFIDSYNTKVDLSTLISGLEGWCISNSYTVNSGINFFYDYSEIIYSTITVGKGEYIPPDEDPNPPEDQGDYEIGGPEFEDPTDDKTIATEKGVANELEKAIIEAIGYMPKFHVEEDGTLFIENPAGEMNITLNPVLDLGDGRIIDLYDLLPPSITDEDGKIIIGGDVLDEIPSEKVLATERAVVDAVEKAFQKCMGFMPKFHLDENAALYIEDPNTGVDTTVAHDNPTMGEEGGWDTPPYQMPDNFYDDNPPVEEPEEPTEPEPEPEPEPDGDIDGAVVGSDDGVVNVDEEETTEGETPTEPEEPVADGTVISSDDGKAETEVITEDEFNENPNYYVIGSDTIDPVNANSRTLATERGAYNLIRSMLDIVKGEVPVIEDKGNGVVTITSNTHGTAVLGAEAAEMEDILNPPEEEPETPPETEPGEELPVFNCTGNCENCPCLYREDKPENTGPIEPVIGGNALVPADDGIGYTISAEEAKKYHFIVENVPVIKHDYFRTEDMVQFFCSELVRRKSYIDEALKTIEDTFGINFKFMNTYGPSRLFTLDNDATYINRVNLSLTFRIGLQVNYDENIITYIKDDIKDFIEDINSIDSIHMSNLVTEITSKYADSLVFFEFVDMNGYGTDNQHLYSMPMPDNVITPEMINIHTLDDFTPDINIIIA